MRSIQRLQYVLLPAALLGAAACSGNVAGDKAADQESAAAQPESAVPAAHESPARSGGVELAVPDGGAGDHAGHDRDGAGHGDEHDGHDHDADAVKPAALADSAGDLDLGDGPRIVYEFGTDEHDFGTAMEGITLAHTFDLVAGGNSELVIKQVKPTCGCTIAKVLIDEEGDWQPYGFGDPIEPGTKIQIGATLHTKGKNGHAKSRINIFSNDPRGTIQLGLEAEVETFFTVIPKHLSFQAMTVGEVQEHIVKINTSKGDRIALDLVESEFPKGMEAELRPVEPDANGNANRWDLWVKVGPDVSEGSIGHTFQLRSDKPIAGAEALPDGSTPVYEVAVSSVGRVTGMISYQPAYIAMGLVRPGQVVPRTVRITSHDKEFDLGEPVVRIVGVSTDEWEYADNFSYLIRPVDGENSIDVEIRLDGMPEDLNGSFRGRAIVEVGHPTKPTVELHITGVCRGGPGAQRATRTPSEKPEVDAKPGGSGK